jgi:hypothetical protein
MANAWTPRSRVVARDGDHAAPGRGARHVGVLEDVRTAVDARALAVPDAEHAIELVGAGRREAQLLRTPQRGGRELLVDARLEHDVLRLQVLLGLPQRLVVAAQGRAAVAADEAGGVPAHQGVALALQHRKLDQRLHAAHEGAAVVQRVLVVQRDGLERLADVVGQGGVHLGLVSVLERQSVCKRAGYVFAFDARIGLG